VSTPRALFVSTYAPTLGTGRALRTYTCVRALAMLGPLDLAYVAHGGEGPSPEYQAIEGIEFHEIGSSRGLRRGALYLQKRLQGVPDVCSRGTSPEVVAAAERLSGTRQRGRVIAGDTSAATGMMDLAATRPVIYNAHNIESEYVLGHIGYRWLSKAMMRRYERRVLAVAAESWMVSRGDIASARELVPGARLRYVPNVVDVAAIAPREAPAVDSPARARLLMVGDFEYTPNRSGLAFLLDEVLPRVWRSRPEARLTLVGRGLEAWSSPDPRVRAAGFVPDLASAYAEADCVVVPLTEGAGTPLKFVEALAYRMPVVATPMAAKGLHVAPGEHYRRGADAAEFAQAVIEVLRDGAEDMASAARALAEREYSIEALAELLSRDPERCSGERRASGAGRRGGGRGVPASAAPLRWLVHAAGAGLGHRYPFVLCYHGVGQVSREADPSGIFVSRELFAEHLDVIADQGYEIVPVGELWKRMSDGSEGAGVGSITFDDGLVKTVREAVPMVLERGMSCSMFVPTGLMGRRHPDLHGEMIISADEVKDLAAVGVEAGGHSVDHVSLTGLGYGDQVDQMRRSRAVLEDLLGRPVTSMAYPYGAFDAQTMRGAEEAGYEVACANSGPGPWRAMCIPREPVFASATALRLRLKMAGLYGPAYALVGGQGWLRRARKASVRP